MCAIDDRIDAPPSGIEPRSFGSLLVTRQYSPLYAIMRLALGGGFKEMMFGEKVYVCCKKCAEPTNALRGGAIGYCHKMA